MHTIDREFEFYSSMKALLDDFLAEYFILVHKPYWGNSIFLKIVENEKIILRDGSNILISRSYRNEICEKIRICNKWELGQMEWKTCQRI